MTIYNADIDHPDWCRESRCEAHLSGAHSAEPMALDYDASTNAMVRSRIWQRPGAPVFVELIIGNIDAGNRCRADLSLAQCAQLGVHLNMSVAAIRADRSHG